MDGDVEVNSLLNLNWLYIDQEGVLWEIGKKGKVFRYDQIHDCFNLVYKLPMESFSEQPDPIRSPMPGLTKTNISGYVIRIQSSSTTRRPNWLPI